MDLATARNPLARLGWNESLDFCRALLAAVPRDDSVRSVTEDVQATVAVLAGDGDAFEQLVDLYQATIASQMQRFSREASVIEELVHDVFVEAYVSLKSYRGRSPFLHWLRKIAVRVGYRYWKRRERERTRTAHLAEQAELTQMTCEDASGASEVLGDLLDRLPPRDRLVLTLLYWDGCTVAEAAELAGWSQTMVKVQAHRARKRLKQWLEETQS